MANKVITEFQLKNIEQSMKQIADYKKLLESVGKMPTGRESTTKEQITLQNKLIQQETLLERLKKASLATELESLRVERERLKLKNLSTPKADTEMQKALANAKRLQQEQFKFEKQLTQQVEKEAEAQYRARVRAIQRSNEEALKIVKRPSASGGGQLSSGLGDILGSFGRFGSVAGNIAAGAITGAGVGAGIAIVKEAIELTKDFGKALLDAGHTAILVSGDFERTTQGLAIFAGSATNAKLELQALDKVALSTPGLLLPDAEQGYNRLRALGFAAKTSTELIRGLGVAGQQVGATSQDINRVITNIIQLSAGSPRATQDIKEAIHSLPNLRGVFQDAFGTTSGDKLGKIFQNNPEQAINKFTEALGKMQSAQPGALGALTGLENAITEVRRAFGEPVLEPFTESVKLATQFIRDNKEELSQLGNIAGTTLRVINSIVGLQILAFNKASDIQQKLFPLTKVILDRIERFLPLNVSGGIGLPADKLITESNEASRETVKFYDERRKSQLQVDQNFFSQKEAYLTGYLTTTKAQELQQIKEVSAFRAEHYKKQLAETNKYYQQTLKDQSISEEDQAKLRAEWVEELNKINNESALNQIKTAQAIAQKEREIFEERTKKAEEFRKKLIDVRDAILSAQSIATENPYVKIFSDFQTGAERAIELTKGLNNGLRNALLGATQNANFRNLFNQRFDTALEVQALRDQGNRILNSNQPITMNFADGGANLVGDLETRLRYARREMARRLNPNLSDAQFDEQERLRNQINAIMSQQPGNVTREQLKIFNEARTLRLAQIAGSVDASVIPNELKRMLAENSFNAADIKARQEAQAFELTKQLFNMLKEGGTGIPVKVVDGEDLVRIVNEAPGSAKVERRARQANTNARYN